MKVFVFQKAANIRKEICSRSIFGFVPFAGLSLSALCGFCLYFLKYRNRKEHKVKRHAKFAKG